jgi:hypothetical protein
VGCVLTDKLGKRLLKLTTALFKHQVELWLGKEFVGIAGKTLVDMGGEELQGQIAQYIVDGALPFRASLCKWDAWRAGRRGRDSKVDPIRVGDASG